MGVRPGERRSNSVEMRGEVDQLQEFGGRTDENHFLARESSEHW